ncbi:MAG: 4Fe-4S dicluster domain-containing protein [Deltaproteobacteria bacterium]|nr:4Fe-4S dicluster domain-containing protein [Deltaproteobacteria bacterium]
MDSTSESRANNLIKIQDMVRSCIQCGTCTGSCPNSFAMDYTPRKMWRMVLMNKENEIFNSKTFILCSSCYYCTLRCPRGLPLTEAMNGLKRLASEKNIKKYKGSTLFYKNFINSVRRHGRVKEMEFMTLYFASMMDPFLPLKYTPIGIKLMLKGKISIEIPSKGSGKLEPVFQRVEQLEGKK